MMMNKKGVIKFSNLMIGSLVFIGILVFFFTFAAELTNTYGAEVSGNFSALAVEYNQLEDFAGQDSTIRQMDNETQFGDTAEQDVSSFFISGGLSATRLITNVGPTFRTLVNLAGSDLSNFIHPIVLDVIIGIVAVVFILFIVVMIMRSRPEV